MDFTTIEREKVFSDRTSIDEFDVNNYRSLDSLMLKCMSLNESGFRFNTEYALKCFNNAYYITILILKDKHPALNVDKYIRIAESDVQQIDENNFVVYNYLFLESMTMAMVVNYLRACEPKVYADEDRNDFLRHIYSYHENGQVFRSPAMSAPMLFFDNILDPSKIKKLTIKRELFYPELPLKETDVNAENKKLKAKIQELEKQIEFLSADISQTAPLGKQLRAYLTLLVLEKIGVKFEYPNTKSWATIVSAMTGAATKTCQNMFIDRPNEEMEETDKEKLNTAFKKVGLDITI